MLFLSWKWSFLKSTSYSKAILFYETLSFNTNRLESKKLSFSSNLSIKPPKNLFSNGATIG